ncbi:MULTISPECIES: efflux RND transporter periplasmic adaptor subunit [unclassified Variovorax]|uniref:efflux RND transporter periplasmic adaptor subunit n=1 Tax=unclassified Variovorax TaxID=663243 RepID=UPI000D11C028|nr:MULTISPECIES: efflux RND transporter periplasmic adaptor subunit [unclassified Variovorax]AVQ84136.1 efflux RND transporter periplasmic adaptor subunit [Variovorax sp. PMC12]QRY31507.1 efflux RND transporter periplasmic adaptor subunit [Variovorax sp. PDNC026]
MTTTLTTATGHPLFQRRSTWLATAALVLVLGGGTWALTHHSAHAAKPEAAQAAPPVQVTTARVKQQDVQVYRSGIGTVASMATVTVKARIDGQLDKVGFVEGQDVKAGQMLAQLDPRTLQAQLAQAQATRAKDQATLANARADLKRYTTLIAQDAATQQQLDTQKALVNQLEATVQNDAAQVKYAEVQLSFTRISSPMDGRVGARLVDPGNIVHAADTNGLVVINQIDPIAVQFTLPEDAVQDINRLQQKSSQPLTVVAYDRSGAQMLGTGKLILLNNQIDTTSGTVQLKGSFANPQHSLWPGQYVNVRLQLDRRPDSLTVPAAAVQRGQDSTYVWVVDDQNKVGNVPVHVVQIADGTAVIDKGLSANQRVVVDGQYKLKPGATVVEPPPAQKGAAGGGTDANKPAGGSSN